MALALLLGGARSGKSTLAVRMARSWPEEVTFVATAVPGDEQMAARIARHREERPPSWRCIEEPLDLSGALERCGERGAIVDCLTLWVANLMERETASAALAEAERVATVASERAAPTVVVSNEVGLGVHPSSARGREFRDLLGRVNLAWAAVAAEALLLVAGRAVELRPVPVGGRSGDA
jgi:adenosyl cobinamide kinase/adenosyl cobinamide phosphate guanylyltransferase